MEDLEADARCRALENKGKFMGMFTFNKKNGNPKKVCMVCDMMVSDKTYFKTELNGKTYYFCNEECKSQFVKNPYKYIQSDLS